MALVFICHWKLTGQLIQRTPTNVVGGNRKHPREGYRAKHFDLDSQQRSDSLCLKCQYCRQPVPLQNCNHWHFSSRTKVTFEGATNFV